MTLVLSTLEGVAIAEHLVVWESRNPRFKFSFGHEFHVLSGCRVELGNLVASQYPCILLFVAINEWILAAVDERIALVIRIDDIVAAPHWLESRELDAQPTNIRRFSELGPTFCVVPFNELLPRVLLLRVEDFDQAIFTNGIVRHDAVSRLEVIVLVSPKLVPCAKIFLEFKVFLDFGLLASWAAACQLYNIKGDSGWVGKHTDWLECFEYNIECIFLDLFGRAYHHG